MAEGIKLRLSAIEPASDFHIRGFRMRVEAYEAPDDLTKYVFVIRRHPADPYTGEVFDEFYTVASFPHLANYPEGAPDPDKGWPFFRRDWIEIDVASTEQYNEVWEDIKANVCHMERAYRRAAELELVDTFWVGDSPPVSE